MKTSLILSLVLIFSGLSVNADQNLPIQKKVKADPMADITANLKNFLKKNGFNNNVLKKEGTVFAGPAPILRTAALKYELIKSKYTSNNDGSYTIVQQSICIHEVQVPIYDLTPGNVTMPFNGDLPSCEVALGEENKVYVVQPFFASAHQYIKLFSNEQPRIMKWMGSGAYFKFDSTNPELPPTASTYIGDDFGAVEVSTKSAVRSASPNVTAECSTSPEGQGECSTPTEYVSAIFEMKDDVK